MPAALARVGPAAVALAEAEGLQAHARSIALRLVTERAATRRPRLDRLTWRRPGSCSRAEINHSYEA